MARVASRILSLDEEIEGDCQATGDFVFSRIGDPVRLKPTHSKSVFDLSNPPLQPLAVSERDGLLFLAHSEGFLVARTKDVIGLSKDAKENGKDPCIEKSCVVDVQIGRVSILSLSGDSSMLAAIVGRDIHLFFVQSLIDKVQEPVISAPVNKFDIVKEFKWRRNSENSFIVLSSNGSLCHGSSTLQLKDVIDNVDAVDWSVDGNFVAIARKCTISILSSNFEEILGMPLLFPSWTVDSGSEVKVDSIKWVRHDSIIIGCVQLKEDCEDDRYLVQVITSGEYNLTEVSCKPLVFSFTDLFDGLSIDMLPTGVGPYLLSDYLDCWNVAFISNKKNIDQHISLLRWLVEDNRYEVVSLKLESDKYIPRIDLQDDEDDNLVLGLAVDKISLYEKIKIQLNLEFNELSPRCILICLTCDGKLTLYHVAWVSEPPDLPKVASSHGDNIANAELCNGSSVESDLCVTTSRLKDELNCSPGKSDIGAELKYFLSSDKMGNRGTLDGVEPGSHPGPGIITSSYSRGPAVEEPNTLSKVGDLGTNSIMYERASDSFAVEGSATGKTLGSTITVESSFGSRVAQKPIVFSGSNSSASSTTKETVASQYNSLGSTIAVESSFGSRIAQKPIGFSGLNSSTSSTTKETVTSQYNSPPDLPTFSKPIGSLISSEKSCQSGLNVSIKSGYPGSSSNLNSSSVAASAKLPGSRQQLLLANSTSSKPRHLESETQFSKQFYNVKEVAKELDDLLSSIESEGGFKDLCTVFQEQSLLALEARLDVLSEVSFIYRNKVENQLMEIQLLHNKMLEVSARQVYMQCIVQQASDNKYWEIWNSQKLSPEFEAKRLHISDLMQNLTNQLIELKRHFNSLEINRFGEYGTKPTGWRAPSHSRAPSRSAPSLHSVYGTVNSQLAAAEQLSECLSKQMALLNIRPPTSEKRKFTKELFESIGLDPKMDAFMSPELNCSKLVPNSARSSFSSTSLKDHSRKPALTCVKAFESARKKDSLDKNWAHFEPSRTTIKRTSQNEHVRSSLDVTFREAKEVFDTQVKAFDIGQKTRMNNLSRVSSEPFSITKRTSDGATSSPSKTTFSYSQPLQYSPSIQEKSSKQESDGQSKSLFKWAKDPSDLPAEPNISSTSHYSQMFQSAATSSKKDEKLGSPFMFDTVTTSLNQSGIHVTKTALTSKQSSVSTHRKLSDTVSPTKTASAAERSQLNQETGLKNEVGILANFTQTSTKNSVVPSTTLSASMLQSAASFSSSSPSFQFAKTVLPNNFLSPNNSNTSSSFSNEISFNSVPFLTSARASEVSLSSNKIGSELERATQASELNSDTAQVSARLNTTKTNDTNDSKLQQVTSQTPATSISFSTPPSATINSVFPAVSDILLEAESIRTMSSSIMTTEKDESLEPNLSEEDEMEEEALETNSVLNFESLGGLSVQSTPSSNVLKPNPFAGSFVPVSTGSASPPLSWNATPGQLFRPPSFNLPVSQPSQSAGSTSLTGGVSGGFSGFGQPAQVGAGQQALGSVLGSFGQSRQLGAGMPGFGFAPSGIPSAGSGSGLANTGGFAGAATGGGFAGLAPNTGGFAGLAPNTGGFAGAATFGGGFAGASSAGGGFAGAASAGGGFAGAASPGGGFALVASASGGFGGAGSGSGFSSGGFGGFSNIQGGSFSGFGAAKSGTGRPPAELLTQMRK